MFKAIGAAVVFGFAAYGFVCWWRKTYRDPQAADDPRNSPGGRAHAD